MSHVWTAKLCIEMTYLSVPCPCVSTVDAVDYPTADTVTIYEVMRFPIPDRYLNIMWTAHRGHPLTWQTRTSPFTVSVIGCHPPSRFFFFFYSGIIHYLYQDGRIMRLIFLFFFLLSSTAFPPASTFNIDQVNHELRRDILVAVNHGGLNKVDNLQPIGLTDR